MIYINGTLVDFKNKKPDYEFSDVVEDYQKTIKDLKERHGNIVRFVTRKGVRIDKNTGMQRPPKGYSWPNKVKFVAADGPQEWIYSSSIASKKDDSLITNDPYFLVTNREVSYRLDEEPDRIFFLTKHGAVRSGKLRIDDPEAEQRQRADQMRIETKFKDLIYSESSPLAENLEMLKMIASKWGIGGVDTMSDYAIRNALYDAVQNGEAKKKKGLSAHGVDEFLKDFNMGDGVKVGALIQQAIDMGYLTFNRESNEWLLSVDKDQMPLSIMMVNSTDTGMSRQKLVEYLLKNKHDAEVLEKTVAGKAVIKYGKVYDRGEVKVPESVTMENVSEAPFNDLQKACKQLGIGALAHGKKTQELRDMVRKELERLVDVE